MRLQSTIIHIVEYCSYWGILQSLIMMEVDNTHMGNNLCSGNVVVTAYDFESRLPGFES